MDNKDAAALRMIHVLEAALPLLIKLGDFIGNGDLNLDRKDSLGVRCDVIGDIRLAIEAGRATFGFGEIPNGTYIDRSDIPSAPAE